MGIFSRISDIVNSNVNAILDRAEDPQKIIRLIIQEMEDTLVEVRTSTVRTIAERKELERKREALLAERDDWERKAEVAVSRDREDLAKGALQMKARIAATIDQLDRQIAQIDAGLAKQSDDIGKLQAKLADAKAREKALLARHTTAAARLKMRSHIYDERITDAFARFERVEKSLDQMEGRVEAFDLGRGRSLAEDLGELESSAAVDDELAALKARMGRTPGRDA